ncbi:Y-family DNA polymerase [Undibacterium sp.]|uniref:Y-family DNA polymerase n=1 Tax=Undibacterium sp. TaxID=1914977 RepID=UPI00374C9F98
MRLWIALYLPLLQLEVFRPHWLADAGAVVLDQNRVSAMSALARNAGVQLDMRRGGVQMLLPDAVFHSREPVREQEALQRVAMALLQYSPQVTGAEDASMLIDVGASLRLFGGVRALCRRIRQTLHALGFSVCMGCATTARGAWLLAHAAALGRPGRRRSLSMKSLTPMLDRLPLALLPAATPWLGWLHGVACRRLGELRRLPRPGLQRRCGKELLQAMDCAYGEANELFSWIVAPPGFRARVELPDRMEHAEAMLLFARSLLVQLTGWLTARQLAVSKITLQLEHERGRQAIPHTALLIALAEPTWREEHLLRLLKERLAHLDLAAPVIAISLEASQVEAMQAPSDSLFPEPGGSPEDHHRLVELLVARLGADNVLQAAPQADHRPEVANAWVPILQRNKPMTLPDKLVRPAWLFARPVSLILRNHRPYYNTELRVVSPAERIEAGWWNGQLVTRDYYIAEGEDHVHYWIYKERIGKEDAHTVWYAQGVFG